MDITKMNNKDFAKMILHNSEEPLIHVLIAVNKWKEIAWSEFDQWKSNTETNNKAYLDKMADDGCDLRSDKAFLVDSVERSLHGSIAVNITAFVEDQLKVIFTIYGIDLGKKPHFEDYLKKIGKDERNSLKHYNDHLFVRALANRFKHSGGKTTQDFIKKHGTIAKLTEVDIDIPYSKYPWDHYITQAKEFLDDCIDKIPCSERE